MKSLLCVLLMCLGVMPLAAQPFSTGVVQSQILVIEFERVFAESLFGQRLARQIEAEGAQIAAENRQIETELVDEERLLTEQRETMEATAFRALADAFDDKVQRLRSEQDAKARALGDRSEASQREFLELVQPVLNALMRESGAVMIMDRRSVFVSVADIDITDRAIARINDAIGDAAPATDP